MSVILIYSLTFQHLIMTLSYTLCSGSVKASNGKVKPSAKVEKPCLPASLEEAVKTKIKLDELRTIIEQVALAIAITSR